MAKGSTAVSEANMVSSDASDKKTIEKNGKTFIPRKELPSVQYLLAHGDPETAHLPKTWCETIGYPVALAIVFGISLLLFHHAPHHLLPPRKKYSIPGIKRLPIFRMNDKPTPPMNGQPVAKVTPASSVVPDERNEKSEF
jgi:hypothetical protein